MSDENKEKSFETPMAPFFGLDMARELGAIDSRLGRVEAGIDRVEIKGDGLGSRLDRVEIRLDQLEGDNREIKREIKEVDARLSAKIEAIDARLSAKIEAVDGRVDKCLVAINRLDERTKNLSMVTWGGIVVLLIAIIAQKLL